MVISQSKKSDAGWQEREVYASVHRGAVWLWTCSAAAEQWTVPVRLKGNCEEL